MPRIAKQMASSSEIISRYLQSEITRGSFPGAQYAVGEDGRIIAEDALGLAVVEPKRIPATLDTIYDMASLTKPLVTSLLVVIFAERGVLDLNATLAGYLSDFDREGKREMTMIQLLTHTSGLPNWRPLYLEAETRAQVPEVIARIPLERHSSQSSREVIYSDLSYVLLGFVLERVTGERLDRLAQKELFNPLGLQRTMFNPPPEMTGEIAATEHGQEFEYANAIADEESRRDEATGGRSDAASQTLSPNEESSVAPSPGRPVAPSQLHPWRRDVIRGAVHDGNAHFMEGVAGHAGLFSTAREAFRLANQSLPGSEVLKPESLRLFGENLTPGCATSRSIAWVLAQTPDCSAGPALPPTAFGHNGFTGTSVWIDPHKRRVFVLLTNRVHPRVDAIDMREIRRRFNTLAVETVSGLKSLVSGSRSRDVSMNQKPETRNPKPRL